MSDLTVPVPFASEPDLAGVVKARAIQCALSRICGMCGSSLASGGMGTTFVGSLEDADANTFRFPGMHPECAEVALERLTGLGLPVLGQERALDSWAVVVTGGFELERPSRRGPDMRVLFHPNAVQERRTVPVNRG